VGAAFGVVRVAVMLVAGTGAGGLQALERRVVRGLVAGVLVVLLVAGGVMDDTPAARSARDPGPSRAEIARGTEGVAATTTTTLEPPALAPAPAAPTADPADEGLAAALPEVLLPGWPRAADDPKRRLGPLDLAAAAAAERDTPAERALLETRHFRRGHARAWRGPDGQVGYASVYEFATPADAAAYLVDGITTIEARGARIYDVAEPAPAGGKGFSQVAQAGAGTASTVSHGVVFVDGTRFFLVFVSADDSASVDPTLAARAAASVAGA
jgi:hypothetical protein